MIVKIINEARTNHHSIIVIDVAVNFQDANIFSSGNVNKVFLLRSNFISVGNRSESDFSTPNAKVELAS